MLFVLIVLVTFDINRITVRKMKSRMQDTKIRLVHDFGCPLKVSLVLERLNLGTTAIGMGWAIVTSGSAFMFVG